MTNQSLCTFSIFSVCILLLSGCAQKEPTIMKLKKDDSAPVDSKATFVNKNIRSMSLQELREKKNELLAKDNKENAVKYVEKMMSLCIDTNDLKQTTLELADLHFDLGDLDKAGKTYEEYVNLYPGDEKVEYADYRSIMCNFYLLLSKERDQTKTQKTVDLTQKFLGRSLYHVYVEDVKNIRIQCINQLIDSEMSIIDFYLNRGSSRSVRSRLANLEKEYVPVMPEVKSRLLLVECRLAEMEKDTVTLAQKKKELAEKFPEIAQAHKNVTANNAHGKKAAERF